MRLEVKAPPKKAEFQLIKLVLLDFLFLFLIFAVAGNAAVIYSGIVQFPQVLLVVPAIIVLAVILVFVRFFGYLSTVFRAMGALSYIYDELGEGAVTTIVDFKAPILLFGFLFKKGMEKTNTKFFSLKMITDSAKYKAETFVTSQHGQYSLDVSVTDWRGNTHARAAKGKMPQLQTAAIKTIADIRTEVLESGGVKTNRIVKTTKEAYHPVQQVIQKIVPSPIPTKSVPAPPPMPTPTQSVPSPKPSVKPELPPVLEPKTVAVKHAEIKQSLETAKTPEEKTAMKDVMFQLEEIQKVMTEKEATKAVLTQLDEINSILDD